jgi:AraC-like DNA-binding protein
MEKNKQIYCVYLWGGQMMYLGRFDDVAEHMHHAVQVVINREEPSALRIDGSSIKCGGVIIGSDRRHQLLSTNDYQVHLWIDSQTAVARAITRQHLGEKGFKVLKGALLKKVRDAIDAPSNFLGPCWQAHDVYEKIVSELGGFEYSEDEVDPRIQTAIKWLQDKHLSQKVTVAELARHSCLSESRLMHLFTKQIGIPIRRYILWLRVLSAMRSIAQGKVSVTEAAHAAGFSDSAHLARTYRRVFGLTISHCLNISRFVQVNSCFF